VIELSSCGAVESLRAGSGREAALWNRERPSVPNRVLVAITVDSVEFAATC
jgi:hypothetical protein